MVQAIALQNEHLTKLTHRYRELREKQAKLREEVPEERLGDRGPAGQHREQMRRERNAFVEEALESKR